MIDPAILAALPDDLEITITIRVGDLLEQGRVRRSSPGRPRQRPRRLVAEKGYSYPPVRQLLADRGIGAVIPRRNDQHPQDGRNRVERLVHRLGQSQRVATRYEKRAQSYLAMLTLAAILAWL